MNLMTDELRRKLPPLYDCEGLPYAYTYAKYFAAWTPHVWWVAEFDGEDTLYGFIEGFPNRWGGFSLRALESERGPEGDGLRKVEFLSPVILAQPWSVWRWLGRRLRPMWAAWSRIAHGGDAQ